MQPIRVLASLLSLLWAGPAMAQSEAPITYRWAQAASAEVAGQRLLGPLARLYPNYSGPFSGVFSSGSLDEVAFASTARASGMEGVCEADVVWLSFESDPEALEAAPADGRAETAPVVVSALRSETGFRAVADTAPRERTDSYEAEFGAACATQTDGWDFGMADDAIDAWVAVRIQAMLPDMAEQESAAFLALLESCGGEECAEPLVLAAQLRRARFGFVDVQPCDPFVDIYGGGRRFDGPFCLKARYVLEETAGETVSLVVNSRFEMRYSADQMMILDPHLSSVGLMQERLVE